ncbi:MAG TPA: DUF3488 and transglutaminase-like domain-containing protein [Burkholderiales bacterium]|nr:DUF3488 and transglutaminase-like domain-containing protein [Burkholderiales bacterium]
MTESGQALALRHVLCLLASLALVTVPHAPRLPWWIGALAAALAAWRAYLGHLRLALPNRWLLLPLAAAATVGVYLHYRTLFGRDAGVALLVVMLALKLLETRSLRDGMLLAFLSYFLIVTNFFYSQSIPTALYMLACTWFITATVVSLHYGRAEPPFTASLRAAGSMLAHAAPLTLAFFLLFPRVQGPLWGLPHDAYAGVSGLSDTMTPGSISNLILSDAVAFRVRFESANPAHRHLYWRGPVMWDFDGRTWSASRFFHSPPEPPQLSGERVAYEITIEPHGKRWLFALDLPAAAPPRALVSSDFQVLSLEPVNQRMRYEMVSYLGSAHGAQERRLALRRALQLPPGSNPRTLEYARALRERFPDDREYINQVLAQFRAQNFLYTLSPALLGEHPVDDFLFRTREGFCEHYASAFVVLMRAAGIPARVVTGYLGGEVNQLGNYIIVRQSDAHAWTEVWLSDRGWVRIDPTAAVSPLRVDAGISAAVPRTDPLPLLVRGDFELLRQLRLTLDLVANAWNQWVLGYTPERQRRFLASVGVSEATWQTLAVALLGITTLIMAGLAVLMLRQIRTRVRDPVRIAYARFCAKLERRGCARRPAEGPADYARRLERLRPDLSAAVNAITRLYIALRYGAGAGPAELAELKRLVRQFTA